MLIGELSKKTNLSKDTIRFYEKMGLITASDQPAGSRIYKQYDATTVERLFLINKAKGLGFTLKEIKQLIDQWENDAIPPGEQIRIIESKLEQIAKKIQNLSEMKSYLAAKLRKLKQEADAVG
ncbi:MULTISPECIES: MerR family transcriptional regulator [unclassified Nodularia (in: cyanobacteria)]|uniref:MerR family transcriptional regulator n=1 Tax=unclassified Nodularia (in: cyanobacteria) TaxID=2656917 RepID=UPI00188235E6|nr:MULTISPECIES: MerR family transcriptional regulator [unclassified Nodularia (in: cyanobacteria)]MBE9197868.1 MerR family transcriptional regulator [Nodularia sp. LEGE 06071]MCC2694606.1 MerR family transcriptional regulator [Nodularia sp. LEGE 04288]